MRGADVVTRMLCYFNIVVIASGFVMYIVSCLIYGFVFDKIIVFLLLLHFIGLFFSYIELTGKNSLWSDTQTR